MFSVKIMNKSFIGTRLPWPSVFLVRACVWGAGCQFLYALPSPLVALTQDAHVVFSLLLVHLDEVVEGVREVLEQCVLLVHLQSQDAVEELGDGTVCGGRRASGCVNSTHSLPSPLDGEGHSPFSTSRQPDLDSRPPMPTDSRPCFMSAEREGFRTCLLPQPAPGPSATSVPLACVRGIFGHKFSLPIPGPHTGPH